MKSVKLLGTALGICGMIFMLAGCATTISSTARSPVTPSWVAHTPPPSGGFTYFVGSGSDNEGNITRANESATHSLIADLTRYLGVMVSSRMSAETKGDLESFRTRLAENMKETSAAKVADFSIADRWIRHNGSQVTVFLLGMYRTAALDAEKARLAALERERTDPVAVPEKAGDRLLAQDKPYAAAVEFIQAALAAAESKAGGASVKLDRNLKKAREALSAIKLTVLRDHLAGPIGKPLPEPFLVSVTSSLSGSSRPIDNAPFRVTYPVPRANGRIGSGFRLLHSSAEGQLSIELPPPGLLGPQTVTVSLDLSSQLDPLLKGASPSSVLVSALASQLSSIKAVLHYTTISEAAHIPTGVLVTDLDRGGTPIPEDDTASGIISSLSQAGYQIVPIPTDPSIVGVDDADLLAILRKSYGAKIKRVVLGKAMISGFDESQGNYIVRVTGQVEVADLATGKVLFSTNQVKLSRATDASSAIAAAFKDLGATIGEEIQNRLY